MRAQINLSCIAIDRVKWSKDGGWDNAMFGGKNLK